MKYAECTSQDVKWTSRARDMSTALSECFSVVFLAIARGQEPIELPVAKTVN